MNRKMSGPLRAALVALLLAAGTNAAQAGYAYVTNAGASAISIVDTATNTVVAQPDIGGTSARAVAVLPNGNFAYVGIANGTQVKVLDTATHAVTATITVGTDPSGIAALPDSSRVYVTNNTSNTVSVIDAATNTVTATIPLNLSGPLGIVISPDGSRAYVGGSAGDIVAVINTATNTVLQLISTDVNTNPQGIDIAPDGSKVYVALTTTSEVAVIDTTSLTITNRYAVGSSVGGVAVSADGTRLFVTGVGTNNVQVVTAATGASVTNIAVGASPQGIAMNADRTRAYVTNLVGNSVSVIDTAGNTVVTTVGSTSQPGSMGRFVSPELARLTVNANGGSVSAGTNAGPRLTCLATCQRNYATTATVTLTATAGLDTEFLGWSGDCSGAAASTTVSMTAARSCTANFTPLQTVAPPPPSWFNSGGAPTTIATHIDTVGEALLSLEPYFINSVANPLVSIAASLPPAFATFFQVFVDTAAQSLSLIFSGLSALPIQAPDLDHAADGTPPNTIYPANATIANLPVAVTATDTTGVSYTFTLNVNARAPRQPAVMAALSATVDGRAFGNAASGKPALSQDGGQVVFQSAATNLVTTAAPAGTDVLRYRALSGDLDRLNQSAFPAGGPTGGALGPASDPAVSNDGRYAAFAATGQGLVLGLDTRGLRQIYRIGLKYPRIDLDPTTPTAELVSGTAAGVAGDGHSDTPVLSRDGRYVVFASAATNLGVAGTGAAQIWRKDMATGGLVLVSADAGGRPLANAAADPAVAADGRFVIFAAGGQVHLKDLGNGALWTVAQGSRPRLSASGETIVFVSGPSVVVVRGGITTIVGAGDQPSVSADGRFVAWRTPAGQIQVGDTFRGVSGLVSHTAAGQPGDAASSDPAISGDGRSIAFATQARDLVGTSLTGTQVILAANPLVDPAATRYWHVTTGDQQSLAVERQGNRAYVASLTYDVQGNSVWYAGLCSFSGLTCAGQLNFVTGGGGIADQRASTAPGAGFAIAFAENGTDATLTLNQKTLALRVFPLGGNTLAPIAGLPEAGWWYNTDDPTGATGWFLATATPNTDGVPGAPVAMLTGAVYDRAGQPFWAVAQGTISGSTSFSFSGTLNRYAGGAPLGASATQSPSASPVGPIAITWTGPRTATAVMPDGQRANLARWSF